MTEKIYIRDLDCYKSATDEQKRQITVDQPDHDLAGQDRRDQKAGQPPFAPACSPAKKSVQDGEQQAGTRKQHAAGTADLPKTQEQKDCV